MKTIRCPRERLLQIVLGNNQRALKAKESDKYLAIQLILNENNDQRSFLIKFEA